MMNAQFLGFKMKDKKISSIRDTIKIQLELL